MPETTLLAGGSLVVGRLQSLNQPCFGLACTFEEEMSRLAADVQNVRLWNQVRSQHQIHLGMRWPFTALRLGLILYWHFDPTHLYDIDGVTRLRDLGEDGIDHIGTMAPSGASLDPGSPSISPNYPC